VKFLNSINKHLKLFRYFEFKILYQPNLNKKKRKDDKYPFLDTIFNFGDWKQFIFNRPALGVKYIQKICPIEFCGHIEFLTHT
jgi:hypothetical protein